ncbi:luciferase [Halobacteriales archaeon SW_7_68_16]|nr:MAG: luciferase [Halobacteriales archaeon SW_7_68_16]
MLQGVTLADAGIDAVAVKPTECAVERATDLAVGTVAVDYEGREHLPSPDTLATLSDAAAVRVTTPVRADGFDPLGDRSAVPDLPDSVGRVLVAGHAAYLDEHERERAVAPRLSEAADACADPWVGTVGIERLALTVGGTQFELLGPKTTARVNALRTAGFEGGLAVYAPTVMTDDEDAVLDALGAYAARRGPAREALPADAATDATAGGRAREVLSQAVRDYGLVGDVDRVRDRVERLREAGVDRVVAYPARGLEPFV